MAPIPTLVVLLRAVNVASHGRVAMADVRAALAAAGYDGVTTYLQTGNVIIPTRVPARIVLADVDRVMTEELGLTTHPTARTARQLARIVAGNPLATTGVEARELAVAYCAAKPSAVAVHALSQREFGDDEWSVRGTEVYLRVPNGLGRSKLAPAMGTVLGVSITVRNWNVTTALAALAAGKQP